MLKALCHISLLNPALHTRIFYKHALSAQKLGYDVSIIAQDKATEPYTLEGIQILPIGPFDRLSLTRWQVQAQILRKALAIQADIYVLHTPELLDLGHKLKTRLGASVMYDVHEDYAFTLQHARHYPAGIRGLMAAWVRRKEQKAIRWLDGVFYAEQLYDNILQARPEQKLVLENTFSPRALQQAPAVEIPAVPYLLYTGTIAEGWGIWEAIKRWEQWNQIEPMHLVVAGHSQFPGLVRQIGQRVQRNGLSDRFQLIGGTSYVPYPDIVQLIQHCHAGLGLYQLLPHLIGKIPTKFFEFLAANKPLIFTPEPHWNAFNAQHQLGFPDTDALHIQQEQIRQWHTDPPVHPPETYLWEAKEEKRLEAFWKRLTGAD